MNQLRLLLCVFISGTAVMAQELLGSRLLAPVFGNSIFVWGSLIGVVLAALSTGYYLGGRLADRQPNLQTLSGLILAAGLLIVALPALTPPVLDAIVMLKVGERYSPVIATISLLATPSILLGMVSPFAVRLATRTVERAGGASGNLYALSTLGSIVGTFLTVFLLIPEFGVNKIILAIGMTLLVVAFLGLGSRMKVLVLVILIILPFAAPYMVSHRLTIAAYTLALGDTVYETDTPYHHLQVADSYDLAHQSTIRILILDDNLHSAMDLNDPNRTVFPYTDYFHLGFLLNPNITRVLFVGGGGFTGPKNFLKNYPNLQVDVVEIDPEVIRVAEQYFWVDASNSRLHIYTGDGRIFLHETSQKYDLIVLDAYSRSYVPFHLMTAEFFKEIVAHLNSGGCVISNLISGISNNNDQLLVAEVNTLHISFPNVYIFPVSGISTPSVQNVILLATLLPQHLSEADFENLAATDATVRNPGLREDVMNYFTISNNNSPILTDNYAPVETLLNPMNGQPITNDQEPPISWMEASKIITALAIVGIIFVILRKKTRTATTQLKE
ncbi:MAG TPA: fused MFS/spermidine synthase [Candidatus Bathyarchaeia archaeon]|nr:fused MFS/spermidine synthase [Candidatus Bathyarchaeia archaeon]